MLLLLLGGCAIYAWTKPGVAPDIAEQELLDCTRQARSISWDVESSLWRSWGWYGPLASPWGPVAPWGWYRPWVHSPPWLRSRWHDPFWVEPDPFWRLDLERRLVDRCMYGKGYDLQKVERNARS